MRIVGVCFVTGAVYDVYDGPDDKCPTNELVDEKLRKLMQNLTFARNIELKARRPSGSEENSLSHELQARQTRAQTSKGLGSSPENVQVGDASMLNLQSNVDFTPSSQMLSNKGEIRNRKIDSNESVGGRAFDI